RIGVGQRARQCGVGRAVPDADEGQRPQDGVLRRLVVGRRQVAEQRRGGAVWPALRQDARRGAGQHQVLAALDLLHALLRPPRPLAVLVVQRRPQERQRLAAGADQVRDGLLARVEVLVAEAAYGLRQAGAVGVGQAALAEEVQQRRYVRADSGGL